MSRWPGRASGIAVALTVFASFLLRVGVRIRLGERTFAEEGYSFFLDIAHDIAAHGLSLAGVRFHGRPPVYPYLLALAGGARAAFLPIVVMQSVFGAGTVLCAFLVGRELFSRRVGLIAAMAAAVYPYYVVHDTAVQETVVLTFFSSLATYWLLLAARRSSYRAAVLAGFALCALVLTRLTMLPFTLLAIGWVAAFAPDRREIRTRLALAVALPLGVPLAGWLTWNAKSSGRVTPSEEVVMQFWMAHNPGTFSAYPDSSIDLSHRRSLAMLTTAERADFRAAADDGAALDRWYARQAWSYIRREPSLAVRSALRMIVVGFSWRLSPRARGVKQLLYTLSYGPIALFALGGALVSRARWREFGVIYANFIGFIIVTMVFWAHTSHRVYLDVFMMIFAAYAVERCIAIAAGSRPRAHMRNPT